MLRDLLLLSRRYYDGAPASSQSVHQLPSAPNYKLTMRRPSKERNLNVNVVNHTAIKVTLGMLEPVHLSARYKSESIVTAGIRTQSGKQRNGTRTTAAFAVVTVCHSILQDCSIDNSDSFAALVVFQYISLILVAMQER